MTCKRHALLSVTLAAGLLLAAGLPAAWAYTPNGGNDTYEIPLQEFDLHSYQSPEVERASLAAMEQFTTDNGGSWHVYSWNPQTGTPRHLYGSGIDLARGLGSGEEAADLARQVIAANPAIFRADLQNLRLKATPHGMGKWAVHFQQTYHGLDVWQGGVQLTFSDAGRLFVMGSTYYNDIQLDPNPTVSSALAMELAQTDLPFDPLTDRVAPEAILLVLPVPQSETEVTHHLVWRVRVHTADPHGVWVTHVDAHSGEIVWRYNDVHFVDFEGDARSIVQFGTYCDGEDEEMSPYLRLTVEGVGTTVTDADGNWTLSYGGTDQREVTADLYGPYIDMNNYNGPEAAFSGMATPGVPFTLGWSDINARHDERDVFDAINDIHDFISLFDPDFGYIHQRISAYVNRTDGFCPGNAWWDGTINFCAEGGGYANTGEIQGVAHHEYGHGIQDFILGQQGGQGLGEGNSDVMANLITRDHHIGRGFYLGNCTSGIRNSLNTLRYPEDVIGQPIHSAGRVIAGFHWDFMDLMRAEYGDDLGIMMAGERWHFGRVLEHPLTQPDQVLATFIADDDDANLDNGTPHHPYLCEAAENHGFECPEILTGLVIVHTPVPSHEEEGDVDVVATIYSWDAPLIAESLLLTYRLNGGDFTVEVMTPTGGTDEYHAIIPGLVQTTLVEYYIEARDEAENVATDPPDAPVTLHTFYVAPQEQILTDDLESGAPGWTHAPAGGGFDDQWHLSTQRNHTSGGETSWKCGDTGSGDYGNLLDAGLVTPSFELLVHSYLHYWQWIDAEESSAYPGRAYDGGLVEISVDGSPWTQIFPDEGYTHTIREGSIPGPFPADTEVFSGSGDWHQVNFDLRDFSGTARLRFRFGTDGADTREGWYVDDVLVEGFIINQAGIAERTFSRLTLRGADPNPFSGRTTLNYELPTPEMVSLQVFDLSGRVVRTLASGTQAAGVYQLEWDGLDDSARQLPAGVYLTRLRAGTQTAAAKVILAR
jgi:hypothetical protein